MAFTKVTNAGIGSTNTVLLHNLNVVGTVTATDGIFSGIGSFGGNVTIGGTLTYEDVTNVDAVGVITARNGISVLGAGVTIAGGGLNVTAGVSTFGGNIKVGTGITLSPDGDLYSVGISTFKDIIYIADKILHDGDGNTGIRFPDADTFSVETAGTQRLRIDSSGDVVIGATSATTVTGGATPFQVSGSDGYTGMSIIRTASAGAQFQFAAGSSGDNVSDNDTLGHFKFFGYHTNGYDEYARIHAEVDGTNGDGDAPGALVFATTADAASSPTERARIDSSGRLLLGTTTEGHSSADDLTIATSGHTGITLRSGTSSTGSIYFSDATSGGDEYNGYIIYNQTDDSLRFGTNENDRLFIDSTGHVLVSHTTSHADMYSKLQVCDTSSAGSIDLGRYTANEHPPYLHFFKSRGASINANTIIQDGDKLGYITFSGNDGGGFHEAASIFGAVDGTPGDNDMPGRLVFKTVPDGSTTSAERMRIDKDGNVGINQNNPNAYGKFVVKGTGNVISLNASSGKASLTFFENGTGRFYLKTLDGGDGLQFVDADGSTERMNIGATGIVNIPALTNSSSLSMNPGSNAGSLVFDRNGHITSMIRAGDGGSNVAGNSGGGSRIFLNKTYLQFLTFPYTTNVGDAPTYTERMRIGASNTLWGTSTVLAGSFDTIRINNSSSHVGTVIRSSGGGGNSQYDEYCWLFHRMGTDGKLVAFNHAGSEEGNISVSGTTVSYNGGHLSRWSQLVGISTNVKSDRPTIYQGTVMSNLDEMCEWPGEENQQLNKTKVSDTVGDKDVAGVFWTWDDDDDVYTNDFYVAMTGDMVIRVAASTTVARGDLLESAGDGTAKPQSDDIVRSKTVAKITSTISTATYADGSKAYPCVLMAS